MRVWTWTWVKNEGGGGAKCFYMVCPLLGCKGHTRQQRTWCILTVMIACPAVQGAWQMMFLDGKRK